MHTCTAHTVDNEWKCPFHPFYCCKVVIFNWDVPYIRVKFVKISYITDIQMNDGFLNMQQTYE